MIRILIVLILSTYSLTGQEIVWNDSKTIGLVPEKNWTKTSNGENLKFQLKSSSFTGSLKGNIEISTAPTLNWTLDELWEEYVIKGFPNSLNGFKKIGSGKSTIDGSESRWIEYYSESQNVKFHGYSEIFVKNNVLYIVTVNSLPKYYAEIEGDFKKMIDSIKIKNGG